MPANYRILAESVENRINPDHLSIEKAFSRTFSLELSTLSYSDVVKYVRLAMKGVGADYTSRSLQAGENAKNHLKSVLTNVCFEYQGSVMTNTHIKAKSDIDLLVISDDFFYFDRARMTEITSNATLQTRYFSSQVQRLRETVEGPVYTKSATETLRALRIDSEVTLARKYNICDITHAKAIKIRNQDVGRDVDVVVANYFDDVTSVVEGRGRWRGIQVYDKDADVRCDVDYPFLSIDKVNQRGIETVDRIKRMIRFLKNMKHKSSHVISLSSFDFNAICYNIEPSLYKGFSFLQLVPVLYKQIKSICDNPWHSDGLMSIDGREPIFKNGPQKLANLRFILAEVNAVLNDLLAANAKVY